MRVLSTHRHAVEPGRAVSLMIASENADPLVEHGKVCAADGFDMQWAPAEIGPLDEEIRTTARRPKLPDLPPEASSHNRNVQVEDALPFNENALPDHVVAGVEEPELHRRPELLEVLGDSALGLVDVDDDLRRRHVVRIAPHRSRVEMSFMASRAARTH